MRAIYKERNDESIDSETLLGLRAERRDMAILASFTFIIAMLLLAVGILAMTSMTLNIASSIRRVSCQPGVLIAVGINRERSRSC